MRARVAWHLNSDISQMACLGDTPVQRNHIFVLVNIVSVNDNVLNRNKEISCSGGTIGCKVVAVDQGATAKTRRSFEDWTIVGIANQYRVQSEVNRPRDPIRSARNKNFGRSSRNLVLIASTPPSIGIDSILQCIRIIFVAIPSRTVCSNVSIYRVSKVIS